MTLAANSHARLTGANSKNPSLLSGLLHDDVGERFVATHATKQGRRYRYYTSRDAVRIRRRGRQGTDTHSQAEDRRLVLRLPAVEVEGAVMRMLVDVLRDQQWLAKHVHDTNASIAARMAISVEAQELASQLEAEDPVTRREAILRLVDYVVLDPAAITVTIKIDTIRWAVPGPSAERDIPALNPDSELSP